VQAWVNKKKWWRHRKIHPPLREVHDGFTDKLLLARAIKSYCGGMAVLRPSAWESIEFPYPSSFDTLNLARTHIRRFCLWIHSVVSRPLRCARSCASGSSHHARMSYIYNSKNYTHYFYYRSLVLGMRSRSGFIPLMRAQVYSTGPCFVLPQSP
jgi:hypothetical protein